jgi:DNA (cytosine-5)-methyltransferase 3A
VNVLSLCDGGSGGQQAFSLNDIKFDGIDNKYYSSEIADYSIKMTQKNYPETIQIGDMTLLSETDLDKYKGIDILLSGTPCKSLSITNTKEHQKGLNGTSKLFYDFVKIKNYIQPKYFLFENVASMSDENKNIITELLGIKPVMIDSALFTAQERKRYYWTNIPLLQLPKANSLILKDIMLKNPSEKLFYDKPFTLNGKDKKVTATLETGWNYEMAKRVYNPNFKSCTLTAVTGGYQEKKVLDNGRPRKLDPVEYERLQGMKDNYTLGVAASKRYSICGDGWNIPTIAHIFKGLS